ncbi:hypothetical protein A1355_00560 [Methylomonas koyamae]|uniref:Uncharacterized protein n=1 Tax=Methylomonas koyamae TaxID=702114 RepID=A0A177NF49_9GAMM|nr:hypothetical protein A1355_00560 [Methylomonas koyamae]
MAANSVKQNGLIGDKRRFIGPPGVGYESRGSPIANAASDNPCGFVTKDDRAGRFYNLIAKKYFSAEKSVGLQKPKVQPSLSADHGRKSRIVAGRALAATQDRLNLDKLPVAAKAPPAASLNAS